jgi:hypothetical protein
MTFLKTSNKRKKKEISRKSRNGKRKLKTEAKHERNKPRNQQSDCT